MKWVVRRTTLSLHFSCNKDHMRRREYGSIPLVGSSNITTLRNNNNNINYITSGMASWIKVISPKLKRYLKKIQKLDPIGNYSMF